MHGRFKYVLLSKYPHLGPRDAALWERFIKTYPDAYELADYDCWIGEGTRPIDENGGENFKDNFAELTKKRIDVCATKHDGSVDCIEVRPHAGSSAIGSVLCNFQLHKDELAGALTGHVIITDTAQADMRQLCAQYDIKLYELDTI